MYQMHRAAWTIKQSTSKRSKPFEAQDSKYRVNILKYYPAVIKPRKEARPCRNSRTHLCFSIRLTASYITFWVNFARKYLRSARPGAVARRRRQTVGFLGNLRAFSNLASLPRKSRGCIRVIAGPRAISARDGLKLNLYFGRRRALCARVHSFYYQKWLPAVHFNFSKKVGPARPLQARLGYKIQLIVPYFVNLRFIVIAKVVAILQSLIQVRNYSRNYESPR